jgi:hypothetical protein
MVVFFFALSTKASQLSAKVAGKPAKTPAFVDNPLTRIAKSQQPTGASAPYASGGT